MQTAVVRHLRATLLVCLACLTSALGQSAWAQDLRDPPGQTITIWPNIPVVRAADIGDYIQDRTAFTALHDTKGEPATIAAALQAVDDLQVHHERMALAQLGRSLNVQFVGEIDKQSRRINTTTTRLRFAFAGITPQELQRAANQDEQALAALKDKTQHLLLAYITYTRMQDVLVQGTVTLVRPSTGVSQSFTVTTPVQELGEALGRAVFDYFTGTRFASHRNPQTNVQWLASAPGHADQLVSREMAQRYCQTQQARLPTAEELETAEASGFYGGGVTLQDQIAYHVQTGLYDPDSAHFDKVRPNHLASVRNGHYYCIRAPQTKTARRAPRK